MNNYDLGEGKGTLQVTKFQSFLKNPNAINNLYVKNFSEEMTVADLENLFE